MKHFTGISEWWSVGGALFQSKNLTNIFKLSKILSTYYDILISPIIFIKN